MNTFKNYDLVGRDGSTWRFNVPPQGNFPVDVQILEHRNMDHHSPLILLHEIAFTHHALANIPQSFAVEEFERAQLFANQYPFATFYKEDDYAKGVLRVGVRIKFDRPHYSVSMTKPDARRLWQYLNQTYGNLSNCV